MNMFFCSCSELAMHDPHRALHGGPCAPLAVFDLGAERYLFASGDSTYLGHAASGEIVPAAAPRPPEVAAVFTTDRCWALWDQAIRGLKSDYRSFSKVWGAGRLTLFEAEPVALADAVHEIRGRAGDLECGDRFDWDRGHGSLAGGGVAVAARFLLSGLHDACSDVRVDTGDALLWLVQHRGHRCYSKTSLVVLRMLLDELAVRLAEERDQHVVRVWKNVTDLRREVEPLR